MSDRDPLRDALAGTADAVRPYLNPPGVEAARRTLRRRRQVRPVLAAVVSLLAALGLSTFVPGRGGPPAVDPTAPPNPTTSPPASPSASAAPSGTPSPSVTASAVNGGAQVPGSPQPKGSPRCVKRGEVWVDWVSSYDIVISARQEWEPFHHICPGETIRVFWVWYVYEPDGSQKLYDSQVFQLTYAKPSVDTGVAVEGCRGDFYVVKGGRAVRQTIPAGDRKAYGGDAVYTTLFDNPCG
ncbi:hypothetical protein QEZ54_04380 [Catellatospora sp. KI3]|uniref:hypothetical protein n=1 Tax=Catellatospora sp. KI3 TaxID=3041620 RepID=UPI002482B604|nr:hypothetical protein [Catellatospora sp. KI3]MDI1460198.1 hypothetical protein [Catellatospora sp. KI3]